MCKKCGNNSCGGGCKKSSNSGSDLANALNQLADLSDKITAISNSVKMFTCMHPIVMLQNADDIALFDLDTGLGSGCAENWAVCDGKTQYSPTDGKNIVLPNLLDKFVVAAGETYAVNDTGGANTVTLDVTMIPAHNHGITDPGHTHTVTDPGHTHSGSQGAHTHSVTFPTHTHTFTTNTTGAHTHSVAVDNQGTGLRGSGETTTATPGVTTYGTDSQGNHYHTGTTDASGGGTQTTTSVAPSITIANAFTGITVASATTSITTTNTGGGLAHENRPPYYALLFVMKL
jgi:microcystin-dependent protein